MAEEQYLRGLIEEVTSQVAAGFLSPETAADRIMAIVGLRKAASG